jgi:antitoxin VapB
MGKEYPAKSFKSGNSVAIRVPAALGIEPDREWSIRREEDVLVLRLKDKAKRRFNIEKVWGCAVGSGLEFIKDEDRVFEERRLLWDEIDPPTRDKPDA